MKNKLKFHFTTLYTFILARWPTSAIKHYRKNLYPFVTDYVFSFCKTKDKTLTEQHGQDKYNEYRSINKITSNNKTGLVCVCVIFFFKLIEWSFHVEIRNVLSATKERKQNEAAFSFSFSKCVRFCVWACVHVGVFALTCPGATPPTSAQRGPGKVVTWDTLKHSATVWFLLYNKLLWH